MQPKFKTSHLMILGLLALLSQAVSITTLQLKGNLVDHLVAKSTTVESLLILVGVFASLQVFGAFANILSENFNRTFSVTEFERHWKRGMPLTIKRPYLGFHHKLYNGLYNNIPKLFGLKVSILLQTLTAVVYAGFFMTRLVHDEFWLGLSFIPIIGLFSWGAGHLYSHSYQEGTKKIATDRVALSSWLELWFRSSRERTINWNDHGRSKDSKSWFNNQGQKVAQGIRQHARVVFKRDLFGSLLVDWPYILCVSTVLISVVQGRLTIGEFLIWTTLIDHLMSAFSSLRFIKKCRLDAKALQDQLDEDLGWIPDAQTLSAPQIPSVPILENESYRFQLLSGETVILSLQPGFYRILGSNGSGKSTLLDTLLGVNDHFDRWDPLQVETLRSKIQNHSRVVERDCVVFPDFQESLTAQIFGEAGPQDHRTTLVTNLARYLPPTLTSVWEQKIAHLELVWNLRPGSLSSGEKVILAFLRMTASLTPDVKLIVVDECDSVLDQSTAALFNQTILSLSSYFAIWYVSHTYVQQTLAASHALPKGHSFMASVYLLGYERQAARGFVTPCQIAALSGGSGQVLGSGNVGEALAQVFNTVKRAFIHHREDYRILDQFDWHLDSVYQEAEVGEIKSAGLVLAVGILSVVRQIKGLSELRGYGATGQILLDGSIVPVNYIEAKLSAAKNLSFITKILSFRDISHLQQLEDSLLKEQVLVTEFGN